MRKQRIPRELEKEESKDQEYKELGTLTRSSRRRRRRSSKRIRRTTRRRREDDKRHEATKRRGTRGSTLPHQLRENRKQCIHVQCLSVVCDVGP